MNELIKTLEEFLEKAQVFGLAGATNHPAVKCKVEGLCLGDFYKLHENINKAKAEILMIRDIVK